MGVIAAADDWTMARGGAWRKGFQCDTMPQGSCAPSGSNWHGPCIHASPSLATTLAPVQIPSHPSHLPKSFSHRLIEPTVAQMPPARVFVVPVARQPAIVPYLSFPPYLRYNNKGSIQAGGGRQGREHVPGAGYGSQFLG